MTTAPPPGQGRWDSTHVCLARGAGLATLDATIRSCLDLAALRRLLEDERHRLQAMLEYTDELVIYTDFQGVVTYVSPRCQGVTGYPADHFLGRTMPDIIHPDDRARCAEVWKEVSEGRRQLRNFEYRIIDGDGKTRWVSHSATLVPGPGGDARRGGMHNALRDITAEKTTQAALASSQELLADTARVARVGGWEIDLQGQTLAWTVETYRIHEVESSKVISVADAINFYHPDDQAMVAELVNRAIQENLPFDFEARILTARGHRRWVRAKGRVRGAGTDHAQVWGTIQDITDHKVAELQVTEGKARMEALVQATPVMVLGLSEDGRIVLFNRFAEDLTGFRAEEVMGDSWYDRFIPPDVRAPVQEAWTKLLQEGDRVHRFENRVRTRQGTDRLISWTNTVVMHENRFLMALCLGQDVTEQRRIEAEITHQLEEKTILLKEVHHRVKNSIAGIEGMLMIQAQAHGNPDVREALEDAVLRVQSMRTLYETLLIGENYRQVGTEEYLGRVVRAVIASLPPGSLGVVDTSLEHISVSANQAVGLGIMVNELLTNVHKYAFTDHRDPRVWIRFALEGNWAVLEVRDNGSGCPSLPQGPGSGFGLAAVRMLAEQMGGRLEVDGSQGTTARILFPWAVS